MPHRLHQVQPDIIASRGVYTLPYRGPEGERYIVAVDRHGQRIAEATVYPSVRDASDLTAVLWSILERCDPVHLTLVRD